MINPEARGRSWSIMLGVLLVLLGIVAIISPVLATATLIKALGWLLILAAIEQAIYGLQNRKEGGIFWNVLLAVAYAIIAGALLLRPASGAIAGTIFIAILFLIDGVTEIGLGLRLGSESRARRWLLAGGSMSLLFGGVILYRFPLSAMWTIGLLVGARLAVKGITQIVRVSPGPQPGVGPGNLNRAA